MALDDDIRILSGVGLFDGFTKDQLRLLAFGAETMRLPAARELFQEGAASDCAFIVVRGRIVLYRDQDDERIIVGHAGPGAMLGEMALISETSRLTGAATEVESELIRLSRKLFRRILEEYPEVAASLHDRIQRDLQALVRRIEGLGPRFES